MTPEWIECPACKGQGEQEHRVSSAGSTPHDSIVRCNICAGIGLITERAAARWNKRPTPPPAPRRRVA